MYVEVHKIIINHLVQHCYVNSCTASFDSTYALLQ